MAGTTTALLTARHRRAYNPLHTSPLPLVVPLSYTVGLFIDSTGLAAGTPSTEVSVVNTGYTRMAVTFDDNMLNAADITFPNPSPNSWGTVRYVGIFAEVAVSTWELWWYGRTIDPATGANYDMVVASGGAPVWIRQGDLYLAIS